MARHQSDAAKAAGDRAVNFFCRRLYLSKGRLVPFIPTPDQASWLRTVFGTLNSDGRRRYRTVYREIPKKNSKALAFTTPIPTPSGWTIMGALRVGDTVFDETGRQCRIEHVTPVMKGHRCFRVEFTDGTSLVCDAGHLWQLDVLTKEYKTEVLATEGLLSSVTTRSDGALNYRLPTVGALECANAGGLDFPPYALGAWLGDGTTTESNITMHEDDAATADHIRSLGIRIERRDRSGRCGLYAMIGEGTRQQNKGRCPRASLRRIGVLGDKHIPTAYLRASIEDRWELLRGLMDTDGSISAAGQCSFVTTKRRLRDDFAELVRTLGLKPTIREDRAMLNGKDCGPYWQIQFWAWSDMPCFRLRRKVERLRKRPDTTTCSATRHIKSITEVDSVPVLCIRVDSPSHLYLAGTGMVPTHNSSDAAGCLLKCLFDEEEYGGEVYSGAATRDQAGRLYQLMATSTRNSPGLFGPNPHTNVGTFRGQPVKLYDRDKRIYVAALDAFYQALSSDANYEDGINPSAAAVDELHRHKSRDLLDVIQEGMGARQQPLLFILTTAGAHQDGPAWEMHQYAADVLSGVAKDETFYAQIYAMAEGEDWEDEAVWAACNPMLQAGVLDIDDFRRAFRQAKRIPSAKRAFLRYHLNQWLAVDETWLPLSTWDANGAEVLPHNWDEEWAGRECFAGLDLSSTSDFTVWSLLFPRDDGGFDVVPRMFIPRGGLDERSSKREDIEDWARAGYITLTPTDAIDYEFVAEAIRRDCRRFSVQEIGFDPWHAPNVINLLGDVPVLMSKVNQHPSVMNAPCRKFETLLAENKIHHYGNPPLRWMAGNVYAETNAYDAMRPSKGRSPDKIDGITATLIALERAIAPRQQVTFRGVIAV